ncbi:MAG: PAS domain S-box protein [Gammaproteobacteria bacterium]|nr:PAS domain S-box protein [Gammaproteobacteria bacterium]
MTNRRGMRTKPREWPAGQLGLPTWLPSLGGERTADRTPLLCATTAAIGAMAFVAVIGALRHLLRSSATQAARPQWFLVLVLCCGCAAFVVSMLRSMRRAIARLEASEARLTRDMSEMGLREEALKRSERRLQTVFETINEGMVVQAADGRVTDANPAAAALLGLTREQLLGRVSADSAWGALREDGSPYPGEQHPAMVTLRTGRPLRNQIMGVRAPGQALRWISINSASIPAERSSEPDAVISTFFDVSELRASYEQIRELAKRLESVRTEERRAVSTTLHEGIAQDLYVAKLGLESLARRLACDPEARIDVAAALAAVEAGMDDLRRIANDLHPVALVHQSLAQLAERHAADFARVSGLEIAVRETGPAVRLDEKATLILFRAIQEALTNVAKHARARRAEVCLRWLAGRLRVEVRDDGVGIDSVGIDGAGLGKPGSLGLIAIRERLAELKGTLEIGPAAPKGTCLRILIPCGTMSA